jgi:hypothetical protein
MVSQTLPYAIAVIKLLQGVVYNDDRNVWNCLTQYQRDIQHYFSGIGVDLLILESEGFAYLKQREDDQNQEEKLPNLIERRQLSYPVTLLSVLLLEKLIEFDAKGGDSTRLILGREEIKESIRVFLPDGSNEAKLIDKVDSHINRLVELGFLKELSTDPNKFEVRRILKAKISMDKLQEIKGKLEDHAKLID